MTQNISTIDRIIRVLIAVVVAILYFTGVVTGTLGIILLAVAAIFVLTSFLGFCPIYWSIGISSKKKEA